MRTIIASALLLVVSTGNCQSTAAVAFSDSNFIYELLIDSNHLNIPDDFTVKYICIVSKKDHREIQEIEAPDNLISSPFGNKKGFGERDFIIEDMNFDGYPDFRLLEYMPAYTYNANYYDWIYDPVSKRYKRDTVLEEIYGAEFDKGSGRIRKFWYEPGNSGHSGSEYYEYVDGKITLVETEENEVVFKKGKKEPEYITKRSRLVNGKMAEVK